MTFITDYQTAGRGRHGRNWSAPRRTSLLFTMALAYPPPEVPATAVMLASLAVSDAINGLTGLDTGIKWPNDVLVGDRKVAGILAELHTDGAERFVTLGIGINVNFDPNLEFAPSFRATSLSREAGRNLSREALAISLFHQIDLWYGVLTETPDRVFSAWSGRLTMLGDPIIVTEGSLTCSGVAIGVERDGGLLVQATDGTIRTVYAADVSLRRSATEP